MLTKKDIQAQFELHRTGNYIYNDCLVFGSSRVEIKCVRLTFDEDGVSSEMLMGVAPLIAKDDTPVAIDWDHYYERPYCKSKDW